MEELKTVINTCSDRGFVSYKQVPAFDRMFFETAKKLQVVSDAGDGDYARRIAVELLRQLKKLETDDDQFPWYEAECICRAVDPYGTDEDICREMESWRQ